MTTERVLVGLGYDDDGRPELDWAAQEAHARAVPLRVMRAYDPSEVAEPWIPSTDRMLRDDLRAMAEQAVDAALAHVRDVWPDVAVDGGPVEADPARTLIEASKTASITVVGGRQLSVLGAAVLGSVSAEVAARASGPVVVVGAHAQGPSEPSSVVVGVDGSAATDDAMTFAFEFAAAHRLPLRAVHCRRRGSAHPDGAEAWLAEVVAGWRGKYPDVEALTEVVVGHPVEALVSAARGSELLVVGPRSRHRVMPALLGSVSQGVLHHARCPVAVVHEREMNR